MKKLKKEDIKKVLEKLTNALDGRIDRYQKAEIKEEDEESKNI